MLGLLIVNPPRVMCLSLEKLRADQDIVIPSSTTTSVDLVHTSHALSLFFLRLVLISLL